MSHALGDAEAAVMARDERHWMRENLFWRGRGTAWWVGVFAPITGMMDPLMIPSPFHFRVVLVVRITLVVLVMLVLRTTRDFSPVREKPLPWIAAGAAVLCSFGGAALASLGGLDEPWLYLGYLMPMWTVPLPMSLRARLGFVGGSLVLFWSAAVLANPLIAAEVKILPVLGAAIFGGMLAALFGHLLWMGERDAFQEGWRRDRLGEAMVRANRDLSARVMARTAELRRTLARLEDVREEERRDLAGLLHDELGQQLTALRLVASLPKEHARVSLEARVDAVQLSVDRVLKRLRPRVLESLGLRAAVDELVVTVARPAGLQPEVDLPAEVGELSAALALDVYRVLQEGVVNTVRHGEATRVLLRVAVRSEEVEVVVEDDGRGMSGRRPGGLGLAGIEDRAQARGGRVELASGRMGGLRLRVVMPRRRLS